MALLVLPLCVQSHKEDRTDRTHGSCNPPILSALEGRQCPFLPSKQAPGPTYAAALPRDSRSICCQTSLSLAVSLVWYRLLMFSNPALSSHFHFRALVPIYYSSDSRLAIGIAAVEIGWGPTCIWWPYSWRLSVWSREQWYRVSYLEADAAQIAQSAHQV